MTKPGVSPRGHSPLILSFLAAAHAPAAYVLQRAPTLDEFILQEVLTGLCVVLLLRYTFTKFLSDVEARAFLVYSG